MYARASLLYKPSAVINIGPIATSLPSVALLPSLPTATDTFPLALPSTPPRTADPGPLAVA
jgi:hypothetical protein